MKKIVSKVVAMIATYSLVANTATLIPVSASSQIDNVLGNMSTHELELYEDMADAFGYSTVRVMFDQMLRSFNASDYYNSIHDMDGDHHITVTDATYVLTFVRGTETYNYDFQCLDVDGNLVINYTDAYIYLQFAGYMLLHPELSYMSFTSGSGNAPIHANEARTYVKHDMSNGTNPSSNDTVYTINSDSTITMETNPWSNPNYNPPATFEEIDTQPNNDLRTSLYTRVQDTRVVRCDGTGFIIGEHTILTNAHCIYNGTYSTTDVCAFTFTSTNEPIRHDLTVLSYYMPMAYVDPSYSNIAINNLSDDYIQTYHDYAIIVVAEDLTSYGQFECGLPLLDLASNTVTTNTVSYGFPQDSDGQCYVTENGVTYRKYTVASYGGVDGFYNQGYWIRTTTTEATAGGMSGCPIILNSVTINNNTISCDETAIGINCTGPTARGPAVVRPIIQFVYGNAILNNQIDAL